MSVALQIRAPFAGWSSALAEIPDEVFARAMLGEGAAIDPTSNELRAPCDGEVISVASARHAVALRAPCGAEILVHVGVDTVALAGEGFTLHASTGEHVKAGDLLVSFDLDLLANRARSLVSPVIVTNGDRFSVARARIDRAVAPGDVLFELEPVGTLDVSHRTTGAAAVSETVIVEHAHGIHARPAALIARLAKTLPDLEIRARGRKADPRSPMALMSLGVRGGDELVIVGFSVDAAQGVAEIAGLIRGLERAAPVPRALAVPSLPAPAQDPRQPRGIVASRGFAVGPAQLLDDEPPVVEESGRGVAAESAALERARSLVRKRLAERSRNASGVVRELMGAHLEMLDDPQLLEPAWRALQDGKSAGFAWRASLAESAQALAATGDERLAERAADLTDLTRQVSRALAGEGEVPADIAPGSILIARDLTPSQLIDVATRLGGIALMGGGPTSHVAILAATLGVPMLVGLGGALRAVAPGTEVILDAEAGTLTTAPAASELAAAHARIAEAQTQAARAIELAQQPCRLASGERIEVFANLAGSAADTRFAVAQGAEGCGLLRTEFLFLERSTAPDEAEQRRRYQEVSDALGALPLVIRTLDIGGDKPIPYLPLPRGGEPGAGVARRAHQPVAAGTASTCSCVRCSRCGQPCGSCCP